MVSKKKKRVMITLSLNTLQNLGELQKIYDMSGSQVVQVLVNKEYQERKNG